MNDIVRPGESPVKKVAPESNTLNLKTPEQEEADKKAAQERAERFATQAGVKQIAHIDSMRFGGASGATSTVNKQENPAMVGEPAGPSVFKLPADQVEQQPVPRQTEEGTPSQDPSNTQVSNNESQQAEKKPGFFKRLFGGGKKQETTLQEQPPQNPEQPSQ